MNKKLRLSIVIPTLAGEVPASVTEAVREREDVELVVVSGMTPVSAARNMGLARARGEYVAWVDADDEICANWLDEIEGALAHQPDIVDFDVIVEWPSAGTAVETPKPYAEGWVAAERYRKDYLTIQIGGQMWSRVIRRELLAGLLFEGGQYEELTLMHSLLSRVRRVWHIAKPIYRYRRRSTGLSQCKHGPNDILRVIHYATEQGGDVLRGVSLMAADYLRHAEEKPRTVVSFLRQNLAALLLAPSVPLRIKLKCVLAALGL